MTEPQQDLLAATRLLVQWGRARQTAWHDPSRDLLAALGTRHASFSDFSDHRPDEPPTPDWRATPQRAASAETTPPPPAVATGSPAALVGRPAPHDPSPTGAVAPAPAPEPPSGHHIARVPTAAAPVTISAASARRRPRNSAVALAAALVLAVVAVPTVWQSYSSSRAPEAPPASRVVIDSTPAGSVVLVDNVERGKTPLVIELPAGIYRVQLRYRKNVRTFDLEVVSGMPAEAAVDWTKKPAIKRKAPPQKSPHAKTAAVMSQPTATAQAATERVPMGVQETTSQAATSSEANPPATAPSSEQPAEAETAR